MCINLYRKSQTSPDNHLSFKFLQLFKKIFVLFPSFFSFFLSFLFLSFFTALLAPGWGPSSALEDAGIWGVSQWISVPQIRKTTIYPSGSYLGDFTDSSQGKSGSRHCRTANYPCIPY